MLAILKNPSILFPSLLASVSLIACASPDVSSDFCAGGKCDTFDNSGCLGPACDDLEGTDFDFIVVGSGAGGGTVASRLAVEGFSVLVLEAGIDAGGTATYQVPAFHPKASEEPGLAWAYFVDHYSEEEMAAKDTKMTQDGILYPRGGTLGGSTAVNAMITVLPKTSDWDRLSQLTNDGSFASREMNRHEDSLDWLTKEPPGITNLVADLLEPEIGLTAITILLNIIDATFIEMVNDGHDGGPDFNILDPFRKLGAYAEFFRTDLNDRLREGNVEGVYSFPQAIEDGKRRGVRERLMESLSTGNLTIKTKALVTHVEFSNVNEQGTCDGPCLAREVSFLDGEALYQADLNSRVTSNPTTRVVGVRDGGEIVLSAGAFNTPQLLMQSGIGERAQLERFDIPVKSDLVGVGENLQDRYEVGIESEFLDSLFPNTGDPQPFVSTEDCNFVALESDLCFQHWSESGKGLYSSNGGIIALLKRSGITEESDLHIFGVPGPFRGYEPNYSAKIPLEESRHLFTWVILKAHTDNRGGTVRLRCTQENDGKCVMNPRVAPDINFHYFQEGIEYEEGGETVTTNLGDRDIEAVVRGIEFVRTIEDETNAEMIGEELIETWPGQGPDAEFALGETFDSEHERLTEFVRRESWGHHASCSAPMGCLPESEIGSHNARAGVCSSEDVFNENTVLDSRFNVRGTTGLRVIDASAFPRIPGTFILLPTYMLAEKGAATLIEDQDLRAAQ